MVLLWIIGLSCLSIFCFILATDPQKSGKERLVFTLYFVISMPIVVMVLGAYLS